MVVRVLVSGAAGQIGYILSTRIANGDLLGRDTPIALVLWDVPDMMKKLSGTVMEIEDCAFPNVVEIIATDNAEVACKDVDVAFLLASHPLKAIGGLRRDLLIANTPIYHQHGAALGRLASRKVKILQVANPANTMCLVAMSAAAGLGPDNWSCMCRLDHNRCIGHLARALGTTAGKVRGVFCWGNHAESLVPDASVAEYEEGGEWKSVAARLGVEFLHGEFVEQIAQRGWKVSAARGATSATSAANAAIDHMRDWIFGTDGRVVSMGIPVPETGPYGVPKGIMSSFPVTIDARGVRSIVGGLALDDWTRGKLAATVADLEAERAEALALLPA